MAAAATVMLIQRWDYAGEERWGGSAWMERWGSFPSSSSSSSRGGCAQTQVEDSLRFHLDSRFLSYVSVPPANCPFNARGSWLQQRRLPERPPPVGGRESTRGDVGGSGPSVPCGEFLSVCINRAEFPASLVGIHRPRHRPCPSAEGGGSFCS